MSILSPTRRQLIAGLASLPMTASTSNLASAQGAGRVKLRLMATTDSHVHVYPYDYYRDMEDQTVGLSKVATLIDEARAEARNSLLFDNGDFVQGNPLGDLIGYERGLKEGDEHPMIRAMNALRYDGGTLGNHEFNYGVPFLDKVLAKAAFPVVSANVVKGAATGDIRRAGTYVKPYVILDRTVTDEAGATHPIKVGVIGVCPPQITTWDKANLAGKLDAFDMVDAAAAFVPEMRERGADIIVMLAHTGMTAAARTGMDENAAHHLARISGIDVMFTGHLHQTFPGPNFRDMPGLDLTKGTIFGVPAVMPGFWGSHLGVIDVELQRDGNRFRMAGFEVANRAIFRREAGRVVPLAEAKTSIMQTVGADHEATLAYVRKPVGRSSVPFETYFAVVSDTAAMQFVADAQLWGAKRLLAGTPHANLPFLSAVAPFKAGGRSGPGFYTDVAAGEIAIKHIADVYLYPNTLQAVRINGEQLMGWLERSAGQFNQIRGVADEQPLVNAAFPTFNFDTIKGVTYQIDVSQPSRFDPAGKLENANATRIVDLRFEGRPVTAADEFVVVTNNYRAAGGGAFPGADGKTVILEAPDPTRDIMIRYMAEIGTISPRPDNNWRLARVPGATNVTFESAPKARTIATLANVRASGDGANGFAKFTIDLSA